MKYIPILLLLLGMLSCDDFLEYKDKDKLIPNELTHYDELIYGEILTKNLGVVGKNIELMTDDATDFIPSTIYETTSDKRKKYRSWYIWAKETQVDEEGFETIDNAWEYFYHAILFFAINFSAMILMAVIGLNFETVTLIMMLIGAYEAYIYNGMYAKLLLQKGYQPVKNKLQGLCINNAVKYAT